MMNLQGDGWLQEGLPVPFGITAELKKSKSKVAPLFDQQAMERIIVVLHDVQQCDELPPLHHHSTEPAFLIGLLSLLLSLALMLLPQQTSAKNIELAQKQTGKRSVSLLKN